MTLTPEQISEYRKSYGLESNNKAGATSTPISADDRINRLRSLAEPSNSPLDTVVNQSKRPGIVQSIAQGVAQPFLRGASSIAGIGTALTGGDVSKINKEGINYGYFGKAQPVGAGFDVRNNVSQNIKPILSATGTGAEVAATIGGGSVGAAKTIAGKAAQIGGLSAVSGGGASLARGDSRGDVMKNALFAGTIGAVLGGGAGVVGKAGGKIIKNAPRGLYNTAIKTDLTDTKNALKFNGKTLGEELIERGVAGSDRKLFRTAKLRLNSSEDELQRLLKDSKQLIHREDLDNYLDPLIERYRNTPGLGPEIDNVKEILKELPERFSLAQANVYKRNIYNALTDTAFRIDPSLSPKREVMKSLAKGLRQEIEDRSSLEVGPDVIRNINKDLSVYGRLQDRMIDKIARANKNNIIGLGDYATLGVGAGVGAITGGGATIGALGLQGAKRVLGSTTVKTGTAIGLNKLGKILEKAPTDKAGKISKTTLINILKQDFGMKSE